MKKHILNQNEIKITLSTLNKHGVEKINIRSIGKEQIKNDIFLTSKIDEIINYIEGLDNNLNIYTTFNCFDTVEKNTVSDKDIKSIKFILLDIDPERHPGTVSTNEQKEQAKKVFYNCLKFLEENGVKYHYTFDSGNGYHALIPVSIDANKVNQDTIKKLLYLLDDKFSTEKAHVDKSVHNPARITRFYGTLNTKGIETTPEECRYSKFLEDNSNGKVNDFKMIENMVNSYSKKENIEYEKMTKNVPYLLVDKPKEWLESHNLLFTKVKYLDNGELYKFESCPMRKHKNNDKGHYFIVDRNRCYFGCHHASCEHQNINTFNEKYPCPKELLMKKVTYSTRKPTLENLEKGEAYKFLNYILNKDGIVQEEKNGERDVISKNPIFIKEIIYDIDNNTFDYVLQAITIGGIKNTFSINGSEFNALSLRSILSKRGVMVTSEYKALSFLQLQIENSEIKYLHNRVGWNSYSELSYNLFNSFNNSTKSTLNELSIFKIKPAGEYETVLTLINEEIIGSNMEIALAVGLSPIILGYLAKTDFPDIGALLVNIMGKSSTGKTTALNFISSIYGSPVENMHTFNATSNALLSILANNFGVATVIDELSSGNVSDMTSLVYQMASGKSKQRLNSDSTLKEQKYFNTTIISSSEVGFRSRLKDNPGLRMRLIEIELDKPWSKNADSSVKIKKVVNKNYGVLATKFMEKLFSHEKGSDLILKHFYNAKEEINLVLPESEYKARISNYYATILSSATLVKELLDINLDNKKLINLFVTLEEKEIPNRKGIPEDIYQKILEFIHKNASKFYYDKTNIKSNGKIGIIKSNNSMIYADIFTGAFEKFLKVDLGIEDVKLALKRLVDEEIILTTDTKRKNTRINICGNRLNCYRVEIPQEDYDMIMKNLAPNENNLLHSNMGENKIVSAIPNESIDDLEL